MLLKQLKYSVQVEILIVLGKIKYLHKGKQN